MTTDPSIDRTALNIGAAILAWIREPTGMRGELLVTRDGMNFLISVEKVARYREPDTVPPIQTKPKRWRRGTWR